MGIYDRDYHRDEDYGEFRRPGFHIQGPLPFTTKLVIVTAVVYLLQLISQGWVTQTFSLRDDWFRRPWQAYQLLTYGFLHSPDDLWHILLNMFGLWMFGRQVEYRYGPREFLVFYLAAVIFAGLAWSLAELFSAPNHLLGASGATAAVLILFAFNFPHQVGLFMFVIPMPMWVMAVVIVLIDAVGAVTHSGNVAFTAHLGGALFAAVYYKANWRLTTWLPEGSWRPRLRRRPKLRIHRDDEKEDETGENAVDDILRKISAHGADSLTRRERRILQQASEREQDKRRGR
jgi:membrane associated rhomboid family serine protease